MSNYIEYNNRIAFHPGYYIKELVEESGLTQEDFAKRLDTTPKNLSVLIRGEQNLSIDISMKLSRLTGTSVAYWFNLQNKYNELLTEFGSEKELTRERDVFKNLDYKYFRDNFGLPDLPREIEKQIIEVRKFLKVATLNAITKRDMTVSFRGATEGLEEANTVKANAMVQIAINKTLQIDAPKYDKRHFEEVVEYALSLTKNHEEFYPLLYKAFLEAGVIFVILPNLPGSKINGATKKIGDNIMLMVNDRRLYADSFWFTLFHEIGHIMNGDYGISFEKERGVQEEEADEFARNSLIPTEAYRMFQSAKQFDYQSIVDFADKINRDPGIVLGRLQNDGIVGFDDWTMNSLRHKYKVKTIV